MWSRTWIWIPSKKIFNNNLSSWASWSFHVKLIYGYKPKDLQQHAMVSLLAWHGWHWTPQHGMPNLPRITVIWLPHKISPHHNLSILQNPIKETQDFKTQARCFCSTTVWSSKINLALNSITKDEQSAPPFTANFILWWLLHIVRSEWLFLY